MITFPNAKINLGLNVVEKRPDNYHNIETVFIPLGLKDILEVVHNTESEAPYMMENTGIVVDAPVQENICVKALELLKKDFDIGPVKIHLHKVIPFGAGLGGGSSDGANMLKLVNDFFELELTNGRLKKYAVQLGADCPFFIENRPVFATGIGDITEPVDINLSGYYFVLIIPDIKVSTPEAYRYVKPKTPEYDLREIIKLPVEEWKGKIINDFEHSVFKQYPGIKKVKDYLYESGAVYASMSGSGSSVYGFFRGKPDLKSNNMFVWVQEF